MAAPYRTLDTAIGDRVLPILYNTGAPTNGTSGTFAGVAQPGWLLETSEPAVYYNSNTLLSPTWTAFSVAGGAGSFTTLAASGAVALSPANANVVLSPTGTGVVTINPATLGTIDNVTLGGTTPAAATVSAFHLDTGTKTAAATAGAATLNKMAGVITSEALTTAAGADYTLTLTNSDIAAADQVFPSVGNGTNTQGDLLVGSTQVSAGSVVIKVRNGHATQALNGTITIAFMVLKN